jgi:hypothetical protein
MNNKERIHWQFSRTKRETPTWNPVCDKENCHRTRTPGGPVKSFLRYVTIGSLLAIGIPCAKAQTFEIGGQQQEQTTPTNKNQRGSNSAQSSSGGFGWGSSIEVGRMAMPEQQRHMQNAQFSQPPRMQSSGSCSVTRHGLLDVIQLR